MANNIVSKKALVLYSGGLDSRLVVRLLQDQDFEVTALHFLLPFGCGCCDFGCNWKFTQNSKTKMVTMDVNKEPYLSKYLQIINDPKYGTGAGINPCKDCKIFMFKLAKEYADKHNIKIIATGEVIGQRPMSQVRSAMQVIDEALGFELLRPLSAKRLPETSFEKEGIVNRNKLLALSGRSRKEQIKLAKEYNITYPNPGGGCFLCEKIPSRRIKTLIEKNLITEKTLPLTMIGRHFLIDNVWFVVARDEKESVLIDRYEKSLEGGKGSPTIYFSDRCGLKNAEKLQVAFSTGDNLEIRETFKRFKL